MMASPLRMCQTTGHYMPTGKHHSKSNGSQDLHFSRIFLDLLVRVARLRLAPELGMGNESLLPDGIQHPQFQPRRAGKGHYVICSRHLSAFDSKPSLPL
jgi:hypothetical protein